MHSPPTPRPLVTLPAILLLLLTISPVLFAEGGDTNGVQAIDRAAELLEEKGYSESERQTLTRELGKASAQSVPVELLVPKIQEGAAKGAGAGRILSALQQERNVLLQARRVVGEIRGGSVFLEKENYDLWQRAAHMLEADLPQSELEQLIRLSLPGPQRFRPLSSLHFSLKQWGLESESSLQVAAALVSSDIPPAEYGAVSDLFRAARRQRISPDQLIRRIEEQAGEVRSVDELSRIILY
ncbi:MAG: hypothetical protein K9L68_11030 [Spirochaetales bacterium]|nr:hypothetical protein [Spirochaetales bacterium]MCF7939119.1 hypothetical protein [Spirochaetales bacterium]